jgi:hypothetical protein
VAKKNGRMDTERLDNLVAQFIKIRDHISRVEEATKAHLRDFYAKREELELAMLEYLDAQGAEMVRTKSGTVSKLVRHTAVLTDPDAFMQFVRENDSYELLDRRANATACREYAVETKGVLPPGVKINSKRYAGVRV